MEVIKRKQAGEKERATTESVKGTKTDREKKVFN